MYIVCIWGSIIDLKSNSIWPIVLCGLQSTIAIRGELYQVKTMLMNYLIEPTMKVMLTIQTSMMKCQETLNFS